MSDPAALLRELCRRGVEVWVEEDRLRFRPQAAVTTDERTQLAAKKPAIVAYLQYVERLCGLYDALTADEMARFAAEVTAGNSMAVLITALMELVEDGGAGVKT